MKTNDKAIQEVLDYADGLKEIAKASRRQDKEYLATMLESCEYGLKRIIEELREDK